MDVPEWGKHDDRHYDHVKFQIFPSRKISIQKDSFGCWYYDSSILCEHIKNSYGMHYNINTVRTPWYLNDTHSLYIFYPIFHCDVYCRAVNISWFVFSYNLYEVATPQK